MKLNIMQGYFFYTFLNGFVEVGSETFCTHASSVNFFIY